MYYLFVDSAFEPGTVQLIKNGLVQEALFVSARLPAFPFESIDQLLAKEGITKNDIQALAVGVGPGSYTGIRTSVAVCQALSFAKDIPLLSVPSLFRHIPEHDGSYLIAHDARMGGAFCLFVEIKQGKVQPDFRVEKLTLDQLASQKEQCIVDERLLERIPTSALLAKESLLSIAPYVDALFQKKEYLLGKSPRIFYESNSI